MSQLSWLAIDVVLLFFAESRKVAWSHNSACGRDRDTLPFVRKGDHISIASHSATFFPFCGFA